MEVPHCISAARGAENLMPRRNPGHKKGPETIRALVSGGDDEDRTHDLRIANAALSQLSYIPDCRMAAIQLYDHVSKFARHRHRVRRNYAYLASALARAAVAAEAGQRTQF